ncbi:rod shape-determining protein RodA [Hyphomicrobium facile]|uniref:Peptidoglycan glycosyltransferase MrdB n=1 Tax=Hyphomicrobium facile TaxID=51670 RepID=A0A1I7N414_9HYPH|nr:rod shape-determining protein RodA [Hyphomicrobium facile]SFV29392.1 cell elongation-specific peptidoglycan biosynthesis regulator RodA [Hyphomicrobium facile]
MMDALFSAWSTSRPLRLSDKLWRIHWPVLLTACLLAGIGTATLYSVSGGSFQPWAERHTLRFLVMLGIVVAMATVRLEVWMKLAYPAYLAALAMLALVPFAGSEALGAKRWIDIGPISFQPSELMKLALVAALARFYFQLPPEKIGKPQYVLAPLVLIGVPVFLTMQQPDLGSACLFVALGLALMFLAGVPLRYFALGGLITIASLPVIWSGMHDYQKRRVEVFINPGMDPLGSGYHITQSKIALGAGGVAGKGFMQGTQSQLDFVPEKHTDFIASIIGEEWGFKGMLVLIAIYALLILMMMIMAQRCENRFARLAIAGSATTFFLYVFFNLAMVTGLVPVVGIPLPLVSYGGTSMTTLMIGLGLAMSAYVHGRAAGR